ncbi:MAG: hypothetical protein FWD69_09405 [Polyangiaceae bacterium]|nr:hypothetical protein [Polyangiaceae bacterium]
MRTYWLFGIVVMLFGCTRGSSSPSSNPTPAASANVASADAGTVELAASSSASATSKAPLGMTSFGLAPPAPATSVAPPGITPADEENVYESALRYMFHHNASMLQQSSRVFCIKFPGNADPPPAFLARFNGNKIPVKPVSACDDVSCNACNVRDKSNGGPGIILRVDAIRWVDANHPVVSGGYNEASMSASGNDYYLERKADGWTVTKDEMRWIS